MRCLGFQKRISGSRNDLVFSETVIKNRVRQTDRGWTPVTTNEKWLKIPGGFDPECEIHERIMQKPGETRLWLRGIWLEIPFRITIPPWEDCDLGLFRAPETTTASDYIIGIDQSKKCKVFKGKVICWVLIGRFWFVNAIESEGIILAFFVLHSAINGFQENDHMMSHPFTILYLHPSCLYPYDFIYP